MKTMNAPVGIDVQRMRDVALLKGEPTIKPKLLSGIYEGFGYGGGIHNFKNLVLPVLALPSANNRWK